MAQGQNSSTRQSPCMPMFEQFRQELDEHHDRRERIIKSSRDITAASKKIIFTLQRIRKLGQPLPTHVEKANKQYYDTIQTQFSSVAKDLQGLNTHRYARQISGGCQEYMEAVLFEHYLTTGSLLSYEEAAEKVQQLSLSNAEPDRSPGVTLSHEDYLLGIYDMTGELMRFAITAMATNGSLPAVTNDEGMTDGAKRDVLNDMRAMRSVLEKLEIGGGPLAKEVDKKMGVMKTSVEKVERALYGLTVRGAERPKGWMPDVNTIEVEG